MNYIDEYKNPALIKALVSKINKNIKKPIKIMEVCGGHTHTIMKYGLMQILPKSVQFVHGPGCPVCVMPKQRIDHAIALALLDDVILVTLGDMIKVPGSKLSLQKARALGADVRSIYSPLDAIKIALQNQNKKVVFFAIGFETTTPMSAVLIKSTIQQNIKNLFFHINHVLVPEILEHLLDDKPDIDAFLGPSHVSVITGSKIYEPIVSKYKKPLVISGFEPSDVLESILMIINQINNKQNLVQNQYSRAVNENGNVKALELINTYMCKRESFKWRGLGSVKNSALRLKDEYEFLDAEKIFDEFLPKVDVKDNKNCICADILKGKAKPYECKVFAKVCTPQNPLGSCMVSSEGACAAYFKYNLNF